MRFELNRRTRELFADFAGVLAAGAASFAVDIVIRDEAVKRIIVAVSAALVPLVRGLVLGLTKGPYLAAMERTLQKLNDDIAAQQAAGVKPQTLRELQSARDQYSLRITNERLREE